MLVNCRNCGLKFSKVLSQIKKTSNDFCSSSCAAVYNNKNNTKRNARLVLHCKNCRQEFPKTHEGHKFCSQECSTEYKWYLKELRIEANKQISVKTLKRYHLIYWPWCLVCELEDWQGKPLTLDLDHIDGDGTNNCLKNTRLICPNCHSQTENYKFKNTNNPLGKEHRRKRYYKKLQKL
jgi:hypothetical protein